MPDTLEVIEGEYTDVNDVAIKFTEEVVEEKESVHTLAKLDARIAELETIILPNLTTDKERRIAQLQAAITALEASAPTDVSAVQAKIDRLKAIRAKVAEKAAEVELTEAEPKVIEK